MRVQKEHQYENKSHDIEIKRLADIMIFSDFNKENQDPSSLESESKILVIIIIYLKERLSIIDQKSLVLLYNLSLLQELKAEVFTAIADNKGDFIK